MAADLGRQQVGNDVARRRPELGTGQPMLSKVPGAKEYGAADIVGQAVGLAPARPSGPGLQLPAVPLTTRTAALEFEALGFDLGSDHRRMGPEALKSRGGQFPG